MNINKILFPLGIILLGILSSCSEDQEYITQGEAIRFGSAIANQTGTKASYDEWDENDAIGIFMKTGSGLTTIVDGAANRKHITSGDGNFSAASANDAVYFPKAGTVDFIAYYPYASSLSGTVYNVDVSDQSSQEKIDLLYSDNAKEKKLNDAVTLNFSHQLSKVIFNITADGEISTLAGLEVSITNMKTSAEFDLADKSLTNNGNATAIVMKTTVNGSAATAEGILLPATASTRKFLFTVAINGEPVTLEWDASSQAFAQGKKNTYNLTLSNRGVQMESVSSIQDWGNGSSIGLGTLEPADLYISNKDMETTVDLSLLQEIIPKEWRFLWGWYSYYLGSASYGVGKGMNGSNCLILKSNSNDPDQDVEIAIAQKATGLTPGKSYIATAYIKTENVAGGSNSTPGFVGIGAHISLEGSYVAKSASVIGTTDWTKVTLNIDVVDSDNIDLYLRLGNSWASSVGTAYFDNITFTENKNSSKYVAESEHIRLIIEKSERSVSESVIQNWLENLDKMYNAYKELFSGRTPFGGKKNEIRSKKLEWDWMWAYAGYPIYWDKDWVSGELEWIKESGTWSFGIMHEMGHNFSATTEGMNGNNSWNWNEELFANFRMFYGLDKTGGVVGMQGGKTYIGGQIATYYKTDAGESYDNVFGQGKSGDGDCMLYTLIRIKNKYGWQIFIKAFDELYSLPRNTSEEDSWSKWQKFNFFMDTLSKYAGEDVRSTYTSTELNLIKAGFS
ncbi:fimbrillin family protein [Dysgonomonas sp. 511]|uniref:fimbrillin family protein n=1 Tax=Dysgonomonas sp. 511 TaxID=2302930 RepID=UPI0013D53D00|nr:fimbrillin family protein [Dysgonomonas sp. 511]NDV79068.1 hypothetical protein [Dysgonomonas sp. 511]